MTIKQKDDFSLKQEVKLSEKEIISFKKRGYNDDLLPKTKEKRHMSTMNYFTLWMGSVHNIPNYTAVGGFLYLGLSPLGVMSALVISSMAVAALLVLNGKAGSTYGIPFSMHLRATYGDVGAKLPGFLRGVVVAIAWFGLQNYTASLALLILIGKIWPDFLLLGSGFSFFGLSFPGLISFTVFWFINLLIGLGGGKALNKFTAILNPLIYVVFIGMAIWAIRVSGGIMSILNFTPEITQSTSSSKLLTYLIIINAVLAVWAGPGASVSDFTQNAVSTKSQRIGQSASLVVGYTIFAFSSVSILIGGSIYYGVDEWNVLNIVNKWDHFPAMLLSIIVLLMTTISTNATGNIVPAAYQLSALFPKQINYKKGVVIASVISFLMMPWKLMDNSESIFNFLNMIGATLGPVAGVMLAHYFFVLKEKINLDELYMDQTKNNQVNSYKGINKEAYIATITALLISLLGQVNDSFSLISKLSFLIGFVMSFSIYLVLKKKTGHKKGKI